jgi:hypothetical protein
MVKSVKYLGLAQKQLCILGPQIWVRFARPAAAKNAGIVNYFENFCRFRPREGGLKLRSIKCEVIFARALSLFQSFKRGV